MSAALEASTCPGKQAEYTVQYCVDWHDRPFAEPCTCRHPGPMALPINMRVEGIRGRSAIVNDGVVCLDCGDDSTGKLDLAEGLNAAFAEMRHVFPFWQRINALVEHRRDELAGQFLPLWMAGPLGLTSAQINEYVLAARVKRAAEYMGERMARYEEPAR